MEKRDFRVPLFDGAPGMTNNNVKKKHSPKIIDKCLIFNCDPDRIQTCNLLIRSQMLYSVKLRGPVSWVQSYTNFHESTKTAPFFMTILAISMKILIRSKRKSPQMLL